MCISNLLFSINYKYLSCAEPGCKKTVLIIVLAWFLYVCVLWPILFFQFWFLKCIKINIKTIAKIFIKQILFFNLIHITRNIYIFAVVHRYMSIKTCLEWSPKLLTSCCGNYSWIYSFYLTERDKNVTHQNQHPKKRLTQIMNSWEWMCNLSAHPRGIKSIIHWEIW